MLDKFLLASKLRHIYPTLAATTQPCLLPNHHHEGLYFLEDLLKSLQQIYNEEMKSVTLEQLKNCMLGMPDICILKIFFPVNYSVVGFRPLLPDQVALPSQSQIDDFIQSKRKGDTILDPAEFPESGEICPSPFSPQKRYFQEEKKHGIPNSEKSDKESEELASSMKTLPFLMESPTKKSFYGESHFEAKEEKIPSMVNDAKYKEIVRKISGAFRNGIYARCSALAQEYHNLYYEKLDSRFMPCSSGYHRHPKISAWAECNQDGFTIEEFDGDGDKFFKRTDLASQVLISKLKSKYLAPLAGDYNRFFLEKLLIGLFAVKTTLSLRVLEQMYEKIFEEPMINMKFAKNALDVVTKLKSPNVRVKIDNKKVTITLVPITESSYVPMTDDETYLEAAEVVSVAGCSSVITHRSHNTPDIPQFSSSESNLKSSGMAIEPAPSTNMDELPSKAHSPSQPFVLKPSNYPLPEFLFPLSMEVSKSHPLLDSPFRFGPFPPRSSQNPMVINPDPHLLYERLSVGHSGYGLVDMPGCSWVEAHENWRMIKATSAFLDC